MLRIVVDGALTGCSSRPVDAIFIQLTHFVSFFVFFWRFAYAKWFNFPTQRILTCAICVYYCVRLEANVNWNDRIYYYFSLYVIWSLAHTRHKWQIIFGPQWRKKIKNKRSNFWVEWKIKQHERIFYMMSQSLALSISICRFICFDWCV